MPRHLSFWLLIALLTLIGFLFFHVVKPFIATLFIAAVLTVLFSPLHQWLTRRFAGHDRIAALVTTLLVMLLVLLPICFTLIMAGTQVMTVGNDAVRWLDVDSPKSFDETIGKIERSRIGAAVDDLYNRLSAGQQEQIKESASNLLHDVTSEVYEKTTGILSDLFSFALSLCIIALGLYYFLADRDLFVGELHRFMPLKNNEQQKLTNRFQVVCRGVVLGSVVAGAVQATLAGIGFAVLGVPNVWVLIVLSMFCSFIPFVGSAVVWLSVAAWLLIEGRYGGGIALAVYGGAIISSSDNLVRAYVIGNRARLHPLIALVTVLGALKLMGLWGIFLGPMVAACFHALLNIMRDRALNEAPNEPVTT
ncbi:AI-2E family transporter [Stieleria varia]|uniref:Putative inner membrane protein n=1 Tax=Stieleria varia TaxID=2528005 RepID=A0A5C6BB49_9BACT|nr:AI-2E family transporter [Stieleria varia]TWU08499.1 putative inner membrane protein [Stieleria varia]